MARYEQECSIGTKRKRSDGKSRILEWKYQSSCWERKKNNENAIIWVVWTKKKICMRKIEHMKGGCNGVRRAMVYKWGSYFLAPNWRHTVQEKNSEPIIPHPSIIAHKSKRKPSRSTDRETGETRIANTRVIGIVSSEREEIQCRKKDDLTTPCRCYIRQGLNTANDREK